MFLRCAVKAGASAPGVMSVAAVMVSAVAACTAAESFGWRGWLWCVYRWGCLTELNLLEWWVEVWSVEVEELRMCGQRLW